MSPEELAVSHLVRPAIDHDRPPSSETTRTVWPCQLLHDRHSRLLTQEGFQSSSSPAGTWALDQVLPPSREYTAAPGTPLPFAPTARQSVTVGQTTPSRCAIPAIGFVRSQRTPPSAVTQAWLEFEEKLTQ